MVISTIKSGKGNQLFQYAIGRKLAIQRKEDLYLYFEESNKISNFNLKYKEYKTPPSKNSLSRLFQKKNALIVDPIWNKIDITNLPENIFLNGFWPYESYFSDCRTLLLEELTLINKSTAFSDLEKFVSSQEATSIHVRRGDYLNPTYQTTFKSLDLKYYDEAIQKMNEHKKMDLFVVFSDGIEWCIKNLKLPENTIFIDSSFKLTDDEELMLMCKNNIIANSTYSWWAAWLNQNKNKLIIRPKEWYNSAVAQSSYENTDMLFLNNSILV